MDLFKYLFSPSQIDKGVQRCRLTADAALVDVRGADEFAEGHIPGAVNVPLANIADIADAADLADGFETPLFVYCRSGSRSREAAYRLEKLGYTDVTDIGGIQSYSGPVAYE